MISWTFHLRWVLWCVGAGWVLLYLSGSFDRFKNQFNDFSEKYFLKLLFGVSAVFFVLALLGKFSQFWALSLNAQDFWLFVDILEQAKKGGFFLTRFAPQSLGFVQHGTVHPMFTWMVLSPLTWVLGTVNVALIFNPLVLTAAGIMVGVIAKKKWGAFYSLVFAMAFLASTQVGKILMYDVHPEAAYPFFVLLWFWSLGLEGSNQIRWVSLVLATFLCVGVKEDSVFVLGPWLLWGLVCLKGNQRKAVISSAVVASFGVLFQVLLVKNWISGAWGPSIWEGHPVIVGAGVGAFRGLHWSGVSDIVSLSLQLIQDQGGVLGFVKGVGSFLLSRPWISLLVLAPWVGVSLRFWWVILPLVCAYSVLEGPRVLWNYYSAPFLASFWICAITADQDQNHSGWDNPGPKIKKAAWALGAALLLGSGSVQIFWPSQQVSEVKLEVQKLLPCIRKRALVPSHLLGLVPLNQVWTDRVPHTKEQWDQLNSILFSPGIGRYELPLDQASKLYTDLLQNPDWVEVGDACSPIQSPTGVGVGVKKVVLFVRK